jgi:Zn-dependent peptidase ImmA (M78 family)
MSNLTENEIRKRAELALDRQAIGRQPVDAQAVADAHGIGVRFVSFDNTEPRRVSDNVAAFYDHEENVIYVNKEATGKEKNFLIAVELGKALLHPMWACSDKYEMSYRSKDALAPEAKDAQIFGRALLVVPGMLAPITQVWSYEKIATLAVIPWQEFQKEIHLIEAYRVARI